MVHYANRANQDKLRYAREMHVYKQQTSDLSLQQENDLTSMERAVQGVANTRSPGFSGPTIADLARKLDKESIDFIIRVFK